MIYRAQIVITDAMVGHSVLGYDKGVKAPYFYILGNIYYG